MAEVAVIHQPHLTHNAKCKTPQKYTETHFTYDKKKKKNFPQKEEVTQVKFRSFVNRNDQS